ncbi:hypothetical protein IQ268_06990 [Oculatella sp. LEGE 06141]|uniref:hypothetical protein n=1 Tax=Oculatella sp. LEGE 06141 TaxID=1828648 RepID=UPI001881471F|nr:hypothetical protein [Oculatella sp. LEGE 06141]MBE9178332.1 hypothetical protein [Oculatella sp. LEGE 06141]
MHNLLDMMSHQRLALFLAPLALSLAATSAVAQDATAAPTRVCAYNPNSGIPNPLGMRAFVSATESGGNTTFTFEQFPSPVGGGSQPVTIASQRTLTIYGVGVENARQLLLANPDYYSELLGYPSEAGFAAVNEVLVCQQAIAPTPVPPVSAPPVSAPPVSSLPDGVYRYWNGAIAPGTVVSDEELLNRGGATFLFRKQGNRVVGTFAYVDGEAICLTGQLNGNTVTGQAFSEDSSVRNTGEQFTAWGPSGFLQVRRGRRVGNRSRYDSALLNLSALSRINTGTRTPASTCQ